MKLPRQSASFSNQILERCDSTNDLARELAEQGHPHGTWVSARIQDAGRGRMGRKWEGRNGNLFLSVIVRISKKALWTWVPLTAAVGVAGALREMNPSWDVRLKWPNDLWLGEAKLGGLLAEAVGAQKDSFIILGLGLNCLEAPEGLDQAAASLVSVSADQVRMPVLHGVLSSLEKLVAEGPDFVARRYQDWAVLVPGTEVAWDSADSGSRIEGTVKGLGASGELLVVSREGGVLSLFAEDVVKGRKIRQPSVRTARSASDESPL